jgi:hypothetical protein
MVIHSRDYVLRLIERLGQLLRQVPGQLRDPAAVPGDLDDDVNEIALQAGFDLGLAIRLSEESLLMLVAPFGEVDSSRCRLLAELLYINGLQAARRGESSLAFANHSRAIHLYRMIRIGEAEETSLPGVTERIMTLEAILADGSVTPGARSDTGEAGATGEAETA